jgi:hypothetical protein
VDDENIVEAALVCPMSAIAAHHLAEGRLAA